MTRKLSTPAAVAGLILFTVFASWAYTWEKTEFAPLNLNGYMGRITAHPTHPAKIYLCTVSLPDILGGGIPEPADGLWITKNAGDHWYRMSDGVFLPDFSVTEVAICKSNPDVMYAGTMMNGIFKSTDGGGSWVDINGSFIYNGESFPNGKWTVTSVAVDPGNPDKVYMGVANIGELDIFNISPDHPGFYYSHDGGLTWISNNDGLPPREDLIFDGSSKTAAPVSIVVLPQMPNYIILGMVEIHANINLVFGRNAATDGRVFYSTSFGTGQFNETSNGLPIDIKQTPEDLGSLVRGSASLMVLSSGNGTSVNLWASHIGITFEANLTTTNIFVRSKGVYNTKTGVWNTKNNGLHYIYEWTDNCSEPEAPQVFKGSYNNLGLGVGRGAASNYCMVGNFRADEGNDNDNTKVYATSNSGGTWLKTWDTGLASSATMGYTEPIVPFVTFNSSNSYIFAPVIWADVDECDASRIDDGVYRLSTAP